MPSNSTTLEYHQHISSHTTLGLLPSFTSLTMYTTTSSSSSCSSSSPPPRESRTLPPSFRGTCYPFLNWFRGFATMDSEALPPAPSLHEVSSAVRLQAYVRGSQARKEHAVLVKYVCRWILLSEHSVRGNDAFSPTCYPISSRLHLIGPLTQTY